MTTFHKEQIIEDLETLRKVGPLVHNITNYVVMNNTANALLAIGASPIMAHAPEEVEEMVAISSTLVINIGTLSEPWVSAMQKAVRKAKSLEKPIVLDPVGAGASQFRNQAIRRIFESGYPSIIRGNASEIMSTLASSGKGKGVDSTESSESALSSAKKLSEETKSVVVVSGETDYIVRENKQSKVQNGHPMMTKVTGLGCTATAICGAFAAVQPDFFRASVSAMAVMGIAGEITIQKALGTGSFQMYFLDALYNLSSGDIANHWKPEIA